MPVIIVFHPIRQFFHYGHRIRQVIHIHLVTLQRFHERFSHPVALRNAYWRRAYDKPEWGSERPCYVRYVATAVIGQPLNGVWQVKRISKALFYILCQQILHHNAIYTTCCGRPEDGFTITAVKAEHHPHDLPSPVADFEAI